MNKLLTIVIPTYNRLPYLKRCLNSILNQYEQDKNYMDIIISDNCSSGGTEDFINGELIIHSFIKYFWHNNNISSDKNFIFLMKFCSSKYLYILSDDDLTGEDSLKNMIDFLINCPTVGLFFFNFINFEGNYADKNHYLRIRSKNFMNILSNDKALPIKTISLYFTLISFKLFNVSNIHSINNKDMFLGIYWSQSYIVLEFASGKNKMLAFISLPTIVYFISPIPMSYYFFDMFGGKRGNLIDFSDGKCKFPQKQILLMYCKELYNVFYIIT